MNAKQIYIFQDIVHNPYLRRHENITRLEQFLKAEPSLFDKCLIAYAIDNGVRSYIIKYLIDKGYDVNMEHLSRTPLLNAIHNGLPDIVDMLLAVGAKITKTDIPAIVFGVKTVNMDKTKPTYYKSHTNEIETRIIESLLRHDPNQVDWHDTNGNTALHKAAMFGNLESARLLVSYGADTSLVNKEGKTALDICRKRKSTTLGFIDTSNFYYGHQSVPTHLVNLNKSLIANLLEKQEVPYLVYKGFRLHTGDYISKDPSPEIVWKLDKSVHHDHRHRPIILFPVPFAECIRKSLEKSLHDAGVTGCSVVLKKNVDEYYEQYKYSYSYLFVFFEEATASTDKNILTDIIKDEPYSMITYTSRIPYSPYMVADVLNEVWSRTNYDVFGELLGYLI